MTRMCSRRPRLLTSMATPSLAALISREIEYARVFPVDLSGAIRDRFFESPNPSLAMLSPWLKNRGYCLRLRWRDTGNNDVVECATIDRYDARGYDRPEAVHLHEVNELEADAYY